MSAVEGRPRHFEPLLGLLLVLHVPDQFLPGILPAAEITPSLFERRLVYRSLLVLIAWNSEVCVNVT